MDRNALGYLTDLNRNVESALVLLQKLAEYPEMKNEEFTILQSHFREQLANTNLIVLDALDDSEQEIMLLAYRERVAYEKKIRDPDDCYLEVMSREEELRKQGLPSQIGLLPGMRKRTREEILSNSFDDQEGADPAQEGDSNKHEPTNGERRS
jgi:hypothetical protein